MKLYSFFNLGNTCYLNSIIQCFINLKYFKETLKKECELSNLLKNIDVDLTNNDECIIYKYNPKEIVSIFMKKFTIFKQHDAHEFLIDFLEKLELNDFYGKIKMNITCSSCKSMSSTFEDFSTINLPFENGTSIVDAFIKYLKKEDIHDYHCEKCNKHILADKNLYLYSLPLFLIIVLKKYNSNGTMTYPFENMKIRETKSNEVFSYSLYAIVYHHGNSENGHYNCVVKINENWCCIDDDTIYLNVSLNFENSYILFYKQNVHPC